MADVLRMTVGEFVGAAAAKAPTPGGGSVGALCGALAAALGSMAVEYTVGKKAYLAYEGELRGALVRFGNARRMLLELIAEDIAAYEGLSVLLKLPVDERLSHPDYAMAVVVAIRAPQTAGGFAMDVLETCAGLLDKTNRFLVSDLGIAATYAHATVLASELNVRVNLPLLPNQEEAAAVRKSLEEMTAKADRLFNEFRTGLLLKMGK
jgi:formiminotetrahydrofolate cyclodeaminase